MTNAEPITMNELRAVLADEIAKIREGTTTAAQVNAISNATGKILSTVRLEMEYYKLVGGTPNIPMMLGPAAKVPARRR